jgi:large subunit ribosomal protein L16
MSSKRVNQRQLVKRPFQIFHKGIDRTFSKKKFIESFRFFNIYSIYNFKFRNISKFTFVVVRSSQYGFISERAIESFRKIISPHFRKKNKKNKDSIFFVRSFAYAPLTKKPSEVRIGGGKGSKLRAWVIPIYPGKTLFEVFFIKKDTAFILFRRAVKKLGINTSIICR